jgi:hypothetical protein
MADNVTASNGGTPVEFATREVAGVHTPIMKDEDLFELIQTLNDLVSRLGVLLSARAVDGTLRTSGTLAVSGGTLATVTTVATVTNVATVANQTAIGGLQASAAIQNQMNTTAQLANTVNIGI